MRVRCAWTLTGATLAGEPVVATFAGRSAGPRHLEVEGALLHRGVRHTLAGQVRVGRRATYALAGDGYTLALDQPLTIRGGPPGFTCVDGVLESHDGRHRLHLRLDPRGGLRAWLRSLHLVPG